MRAAPACDQDFGFGKQPFGSRIGEILDGLGGENTPYGSHPLDDLWRDDMLRARRLHGEGDGGPSHGICPGAWIALTVSPLSLTRASSSRRAMAKPPSAVRSGRGVMTRWTRICQGAAGRSHVSTATSGQGDHFE